VLGYTRQAMSEPADRPDVAAPSQSARAPAVGQSDEVFPAGGFKLDAIERGFIEKALATARNNKSQAAKLLGVPRGQLYSLLRRPGLTDARR
jgi:DNA-binding NtrC family response regulator